VDGQLKVQGSRLNIGNPNVLGKVIKADDEISISNSLGSIVWLFI